MDDFLIFVFLVIGGFLFFGYLTYLLFSKPEGTKDLVEFSKNNPFAFWLRSEGADGIAIVMILVLFLVFSCLLCFLLFGLVYSFAMA